MQKWYGAFAEVGHVAAHIWADHHTGHAHNGWLSGRGSGSVTSKAIRIRPVSACLSNASLSTKLPPGNIHQQRTVAHPRQHIVIDQSAGCSVKGAAITTTSASAPDPPVGLPTSLLAAPAGLLESTAHGLLKMMRPATEFRYVLHTLPDVPEVLEFLVGRTEMSIPEAYATLNMGLGYVAVVAPADAERKVEIARQAGYGGFIAGEVVSGGRSVSVPSLGIEYHGGQLGIG